MGEENLIPLNRRTKEEQREIATQGGKASGAARRLRRTLREALKNALGCEIPKASPHYKRVKAQMQALGIEGEPTVQDIPVLGMIVKSAKDPTAFAIVRDTIGEKPVEEYQDLTPHSPILLGMIPADKVAAAQAEHDKRQLENNKQEA